MIDPAGLSQLYQISMLRVLAYSEDSRMNKPKQGYEPEWRSALIESTLLKTMMEGEEVCGP